MISLRLYMHIKIRKIIDVILVCPCLSAELLIIALSASAPLFYMTGLGRSPVTASCVSVRKSNIQRSFRDDSDLQVTCSGAEPDFSYNYFASGQPSL